MSTVAVETVRARAEILEREIRALQASERAAREREIALRCELDAEKMKTHRRRSNVQNGASTAVRDDDHAFVSVESARGTVPTPTVARGTEPARARAEGPVGRAASTSDERGTTTERVVRDSDVRRDGGMVVLDATSMELAVARAVERAVRDAEDARSSHEEEERVRRDRADARALVSARNRAGELALELREARALAKQWQERAEAAIETSDTMASAYERLRDATRLVDQSGVERGLVTAEETRKLVKELEMMRERLKESQWAIHTRDEARDRLALELRKANESVVELKTALAETKAESEHARELVSVEYAEKQRLNDEVTYLKNEIDRLRATNDEEVRAFNEWRESTEREEKERNRELQQARRDIARQAMKVRELEREMARRQADVSEKQSRDNELTRARRELESLRAMNRELMSERDMFSRRVKELENSPRARRGFAGKISESSAREAEGERTEDEDEDEDEDDDVFDETTSNIVKSSVEDFFDEDDELDAQLEADRERAYALARRLQSIESRAAVLLSLRE